MPSVCSAAVGYLVLGFFFPKKPGMPRFWGRLPVLRGGRCIQGESPPSGKGCPLCLGGPVGCLSLPGSTKANGPKKPCAPQGAQGSTRAGGGGCAQGNLSLIPVPVGKGGLLVPPRRF